MPLTLRHFADPVHKPTRMSREDFIASRIEGLGEGVHAPALVADATQYVARVWNACAVTGARQLPELLTSIGHSQGDLQG